MQQYVIPMLTRSICQMTALRCTGQQEAGEGEGQCPALHCCSAGNPGIALAAAAAAAAAGLHSAMQPSPAPTSVAQHTKAQPSEAAPGAGKAVVHDKIDGRPHDCAPVVKRVQRQEMRQAVEACSRCTTKCVVDCKRWRQSRQSGSLLAQRRSLAMFESPKQGTSKQSSRPAAGFPSHSPEADSR